jgi:hypothetical protein
MPARARSPYSNFSRARRALKAEINQIFNCDKKNPKGSLSDFEVRINLRKTTD